MNDVWLCQVFVVTRGLSFHSAGAILDPQPGIKLMSPALEGGLLTTEPPGKFPLTKFYWMNKWAKCIENNGKRNMSCKELREGRSNPLVWFERCPGRNPSTAMSSSCEFLIMSQVFYKYKTMVLPHVLLIKASETVRQQAVPERSLNAKNDGQ